VATCVWEASRMDAAAVTTQIEDLLKAHAAYMAKEPPYSTAEQIELIVRMEAAIDRLAPRSSRYVKEAESFRRDQPRPRGVRLAGVLQALKEDVNAGWLKTVEELSGLPEVLHVTVGQPGSAVRAASSSGQMTAPLMAARSAALTQLGR
jgi:hypothetical protein